MTTIVFAVLAAALIVLVFLVLACLHEEHRYPHPDQEASGGRNSAGWTGSTGSATG